MWPKPGSGDVASQRMQAEAMGARKHLTANACTLFHGRLRAQLARPALRRLQAPHAHAEGLAEVGVLQCPPLPKAPHGPHGTTPSSPRAELDGPLRAVARDPNVRRFERVEGQEDGASQARPRSRIRV
jgi:hypothetical protein